MSTKKTFERDGYSITLYLNSDNSVDLRRKLLVKYVLPDGQEQELEGYPTGGDKNPKVATVDDQFEYAKTLFRFDKALLKKGLNPIGHGGARKGSGRKKKEYKVMGPFKFEGGVAKILEEQTETTITGYIENAVLFYYNYQQKTSK